MSTLAPARAYKPSAHVTWAGGVYTVDRGNLFDGLDMIVNQAAEPIDNRATVSHLGRSGVIGSVTFDPFEVAVDITGWDVLPGVHRGKVDYLDSSDRFVEIPFVAKLVCAEERNGKLLARYSVEVE